MDARLAGLAGRLGARYTRYADDITFSFDIDDRKLIHRAIRITKMIVSDFGYKLHHKKKLTIRRRYERQQVTGLVVNERVALPRKTRRWLRAVRHHLAVGKQASLTSRQLNGWHALQSMIETQSQGPGN
jgi:hypothetical protein